MNIKDAKEQIKMQLLVIFQKMNLVIMLFLLRGKDRYF